MIIELIISALMIAIPVVYVLDAAGIVEKFKRWKYYRRYSKDSPYVPYDLKPFDCSKCLSVWLYWTIYTYIYYSQGVLLDNIYLIIVGGFLAGLLSIAINKYIIRW